MNFAKRVFATAGIYGLIVITPQFVLEAETGRQYPPAVTHPEFYYGFVGVAFAWQVLFLVLARDPVRYRPMMIPAMIEKFSFGLACPVLYAQGRIPLMVQGFATVDLVLGVLFVIAYLRTPAGDNTL